jgi:hypothetical protein
MSFFYGDAVSAKLGDRLKTAEFSQINHGLPGGGGTFAMCDIAHGHMYFRGTLYQRLSVSVMSPAYSNRMQMSLRTNEGTFIPRLIARRKFVSGDSLCGARLRFMYRSFDL